MPSGENSSVPVGRASFSEDLADLACRVLFQTSRGARQTSAGARQGPLRPYSEYSRANSYPWRPFPPRRARPGPGPHTKHPLHTQPRSSPTQPPIPPNQEKKDTSGF